MNGNLAYVYSEVIDMQMPTYLPAAPLMLFEQYETIGANDDSFEMEFDDDYCNLYFVPS